MMTEFSKKELEALLKDTEEHLAETKRSGPGYYGIRERYDYAVEADERYIEKLKKQIADYDLNTLNENQQVVLDWLKKNAEWGTPTGLIYELTKRNSMAAEYIITAHDQLNKLEQFQVLAAFAEWGMKEVAE
ncbi:hypothetical protein P7D85_06730 [Enterococcus hulanensis]|uniref:Phage protein n=2 Tax=Enterococcus hulanensis TaxID=2559929 RepID=A0ABU3EX82_9ENTE|nr:hypothetical protein [Enterococcus hulanensis]MDT2599464.1 hypothetical protein [Enterococcus hulanensis]MDT2608871.1 hypothetical protein [Enterococcus hulanensis]MDT2616626.1 hypothetical protein [Enterococcus hulanensis]MDT2627334.1 hypothetical protein [Enterococcus hulanensis]MDT2657200.1 hypothetical protein [Enterococcus hulanensis]